jgi:serine/threonine protein phosphatase 1
LAFRFLKSRKVVPVEHLPNTGGDLVYAIGDIHGRLDLLDDLIRTVRSDAAARHPGLTPRLVFLGDYIDRGPASRQVIDRLISLQTEFPVVTVKGNHEEALLRFLEDPEASWTWAQHGGGDTLASYGVLPANKADAGSWRVTRDALLARMPPEHTVFLRNLAPYHCVGDYLFVHAGVRPRVRIEDQSAHDLMWIRNAFLDDPKPSDRVVVHGHTPTQHAHLGRWRIGIDTGAYATGVLTALKLLDDRQEILDTRVGTWNANGSRIA